MRGWLRFLGQGKRTGDTPGVQTDVAQPLMTQAREGSDPTAASLGRGPEKLKDSRDRAALQFDLAVRDVQASSPEVKFEPWLIAKLEEYATRTGEPSALPLTTDSLSAATSALDGSTEQPILTDRRLRGTSRYGFKLGSP